MDRQGKAIQLTSVRRFSHEWEGAASLLLRVGDVAAFQAYAAHGRLRHGEYAEMIDQAYERWASDIQAKVSSILIAPDNETVTVLNERAHDELVDQGRVDAVRTVLLRDRLSAGQGDTVIARMNDRRLTDDSGDFIRNGTLIKITAKPGQDGSVLGRRLDTDRTIRLDSEYFAEATELGDATTAHRSQGITADTRHTLLTQGCLTRGLFYVGMTRGRDSNTAYVCESGPCHDDELHEGPESPWLEIIGELLAAEGSERAAHEVGDENTATPIPCTVSQLSMTTSRRSPLPMTFVPPSNVSNRGSRTVWSVPHPGVRVSPHGGGPLLMSPMLRQRRWSAPFDAPAMPRMSWPSCMHGSVSSVETSPLVSMIGCRRTSSVAGQIWQT